MGSRSDLLANADHMPLLIWRRIGVAVVQHETKDVLRRRLIMFTTAITILASLNIGLILFSSKSKTPFGIATTGIVSLVLLAAIHYAAARSR